MEDEANTGGDTRLFLHSQKKKNEFQTKAPQSKQSIEDVYILLSHNIGEDKKNYFT